MIIPDEILLQVTKPARYTGGEINMVVKDPKDVAIRFGFCFPDVYEVGMSHLGLQILYFLLNRREDTYCERVFAPWPDMEEIMRREDIPLFSLESFDSVTEFDFLGFTLQYEMSYTNIINMLSLGKIPFYSKDRLLHHPIICAGGPCAYNPEPLADIIDFFYIGEGEAMLDRVLDIYRQVKESGGTRNDFLKAILPIEGIYVPKYYDVSYTKEGLIQEFKINDPSAPEQIQKVIVNQLDEVFFPDKQLVPLIETVHDRVSLEVFRGCMRGCRFCQAGYVYRPMREKNPQDLIKQSESLLKNSGHEEISLLSLSTGDYSGFKELAEGLLDRYEKQQVNLSLPSLRIDAFNLDLMEKAQKVRKSSLTFAPEAGTQRLRDVINKGITEEEILKGSSLAFSGGWHKIKLYFMVGLPTETEEDIAGIMGLAGAIVEKYYEMPKEKRKQPVGVTVSTSCFVPKPFTPFQWEAQDAYEVFMEKQRYLKKCNEKKQIRYTYHDAGLSVMEGVLARGDRRLSAVIIKAWSLGARFDGWTEYFNYETWCKALNECGLSAEFYANRKRRIDEILPWDHISIGVSKEYLITEYEKSKNEAVTPNCRSQCQHCGAGDYGGGICHE